MKIVDPWIQVEEYDSVKIMKNIERACRTCYRSEGNITEDSYKKLITNCINRGHESVLEHEKITIRLTCDIGVYKDLTRHRMASFAIESTRFCNYSKGKYGNELTFMRPSNMEEGSEIYNIWYKTMEMIEKSYLEMAEKGAKADQLRMMLPHSTKADVIMTANIREWRHIFKLRCAPAAHPSVQEIMIMLLNEFRKKIPVLFDDIPYGEIEKQAA